MADDIVQRIVLTGSNEVNQAFDSMGAAGARAGRVIQDAFQLGGLQGAAFAFTGIATAIGLVTAAAFEFTRSMAESVDTVGDLAEQLGISTEEVSGLQSAFAAGGVSASQMEGSFRRLAQVTQTTWDQIKRASAEGADKLKGAALGVEQALLNQAKAQDNLANLERDQADARVKSTNAVRDAEFRLREVRLSQARDRGVDTSNQEASLKRARDRAALESAQIALADAQLKKSREADDQAQAAASAKLAVEKSGLELNEARRKERTAEKNDITNIIDAVKKTAEGDTEALKSIDATADNIVKGIIGAAGDASQALGQLNGDITDLASPAPKAQQVLEQLGKVLQNIEEPMLRQAVAAKVFGRAIKQDFIDVLADPDKLQKFQERVQTLGIGINEDDIDASKRFKESLSQLQSDISLVGSKVATALGPGLVSILEDTDASVVRLKDTFVSLAEGLSSNAIEPFVEALKSIAALGGAGLDLIGTVLEAIARAINSIAGTDLSGLDAAFLPFKIVLESIAGLLNTIRRSMEAIRDLTSGDFGKAFDRITGKVDKDEAAAAKAQKEADDALDKQITENKKRRQKELADATKITSEKIGAEQKSALAKVDDDHKVSTESRKSQVKELETANKQTLDTVTAASAGIKKVAETTKAAAPETKLPDGSIIDANGIRHTQGPSGSGVIEGALGAMKRAIEQKTGQVVDSINGNNFGTGQPIQGFDGSFPVIRQKADEPKTKEEFDKRQTKALEDLAEDFASQRKLSEDIGRQNGGVQKTSQWPDGVNPSYVPPVLGKYDPRTQEFIPNNKNLGPGMMPRNNDYEFAGQKNPFPYQPGINAPTSFPAYNKALRDSLPFEADLPKTPEATQPLTDAVQKGFEQAIAGADTFNKLRSSRPEDLSPTGIPTGDTSPVPGTIPAPPPQQGLAPELQGGLPNLLDAIRSAIANMSQVNPSPGEAGETPPVQGLDELSSESSDAASGLSNVNSAADAASLALQGLASSAGSSSGGDSEGFADGGLVRGPGGPRDDLIPAFLSNREFVHNADAVAHYGVDFMHAINGMRLPKFNMGGLVSMFNNSTPRYRSGGLVVPAASNSSHLGTVDLRTDYGRVSVSASPGAVAQLQKAAVTKRITSTGRKPGFVG